MKKAGVVAALILFWVLGTAPVRAHDACTLIVEAQTGDVVYHNGSDCDVPYSPGSTFKVALALMGFDSGLLIDPQTPIEPYKAVYRSGLKVWRQNTSPSSWLQHSVVWYSQVLTTKLRGPALKDYTQAFEYGNMDLAGDPGESNGLTRAWLSSSLQITPTNQARFLRRLVLGELPTAPLALEHTIDAMPAYKRDEGWVVRGKTGTVYLPDDEGNSTDIQAGWFVGWAEKEDQTLIFTHLIVDEQEEKQFAGGRAQRAFLPEFDALASSGFTR